MQPTCSTQTTCKTKTLSILRVAAVALLALIAPQAAQAADITFLGETYAQAHSDIRTTGNSVVEYVRPTETIGSWSKLAGGHRFPDNSETPKEAVLAFAAVLKKIDPANRYAIIENPQTGEAIIDFLVSKEGSDTVEFNIYKYARHPSGNGLIALQFAQRFELGKVNADELKAVRSKAIDEAAKFDMSLIIPVIVN